jgi:hypothetical protein
LKWLNNPGFSQSASKHVPASFPPTGLKTGWQIGTIVHYTSETLFIMLSKFPIHFQFDGRSYLGQIQPLKSNTGGNMPTNFQVFLNNIYCGEIKRKGSKWETDSPKCAIMVDTIGNHIDSNL